MKNPSRVRRIGLLVAFALVAPGGLGTVLSFLGRFSPLLELTTNLPLQYLALLVPGTLILGWYRLTKIAILSSILALINLLVILPLYLDDSTPQLESDAKIYRALLLNLDWKNSDDEAVIALVGNTNPDFILFLEATPAWMASLEELQPIYPFIETGLQPDPGSIAFFSRIPPRTTEIVDFGVSERPAIVAKMTLDDQPLTIIGLHPYPFASRGVVKAQERQQQLDGLATFVTNQSDPVLVLADMNFTPWSPLHRQLLQESGLRDTRQGFGLKLSWPTNYPFLFMPIDHGLISPSIKITNFEIGPHVGSDHLPVIIDFIIGEEIDQ